MTSVAVLLVQRLGHCYDLVVGKTPSSTGTEMSWPAERVREGALYFHLGLHKASHARSRDEFLPLVDTLKCVGDYLDMAETPWSKPAWDECWWDWTWSAYRGLHPNRWASPDHHLMLDSDFVVGAGRDIQG